MYIPYLSNRVKPVSDDSRYAKPSDRHKSSRRAIISDYKAAMAGCFAKTIDRWILPSSPNLKYGGRPAEILGEVEFL